MRYIILIVIVLSRLSLASEKLDTSGQSVETREVPLEQLNELHGISQVFIYESNQNILEKVAQAHLFYLLANDDNPEVFKAVMKATLHSMKADLMFILESEYAKEHQKDRARKMLDELKKSGVFKE